MDHSLFELPDWYKALTLTERAATLRRAPDRSSSTGDEALPSAAWHAGAGRSPSRATASSPAVSLSTA